MLDRGVSDLNAAGLENVALIRADATELPFRDAVFDGVCCFAALHLFADPPVALDEMRRVLAPGGRIALMTSVRRQLTLRPLKPLLEGTSGMRIFESDEIVDALGERGFRERPPASGGDGAVRRRTSPAARPPRGAKPSTIRAW